LSEHEVVQHEEWLAARRALLTREKEFTRRRDELSRARRELPWERVEKAYVFATPGGEETLADLFAGRSQLIVEQPVYNFGTIAPGVADREGVSVFFKDEVGALYRNYSTYARGIDLLNTAYNFLGLTPLGRGEEGRPNQYWVRRHDEYGA
jgi:predicted dithiol-disulfide oxidoreductase (DUF899 family)